MCKWAQFLHLFIQSKFLFWRKWLKLYCETSFHLDILLTNAFFRHSLQRCSIKKLFLKISQNSQENTMCLSLFVNKVAGRRPATLSKKRLWYRWFCEISKNTFFTEHLRTVASDSFTETNWEHRTLTDCSI